ncbi:MAG: hypothetical protein MMC33_007253 [Icmadophila ericetorum]|nr:hypothetical protein [Icmadophila ericetorum]
MLCLFLKLGDNGEQEKLESAVRLEIDEKTKVERADQISEDDQINVVKASQFPRPPSKPSLLEELFPEDVRKPQNEQNGEIDKEDDLPRLPLLDFSADGDISKGQAAISQQQTQQSLRHEELTVMVLYRISTSLIESDFRRIAPKGAHIDQWRGAGDILEIIPGRSTDTLQPTSIYFLIFRNTAYAQLFEKHLHHRHRLATKYTPKSLESPPSPPPGKLINNEDVYSLLQDFALCPPSARLSLRVLPPPYAGSIKALLNKGGYNRIVTPQNKSGRSVLFWVEGIRPTMFSVRTMLAKNGQERGLQWGPLRGYGSIEMLESSQEVDEVEPESPTETDLKHKRAKVARWIIAFEDEAEARRFIRVWHRQPYPFALLQEKTPPGQPPSLVHAEFLW